jgi:hypothetical protein
MITFEDLKSQWKNQQQENTPNNGSELIVKKIDTIKRKQRITNVVLLSTIGILTSFFFYVDAYKYGLVSFALVLMISSLLVRIFIEYISLKKLKHINITTNAAVFNINMITYYKNRIRTHYVSTPIIILLYSVGFIILLPFFKKSLSAGFYNYIICSAIIILIIMVFYIRKQIKKELSVLKGMSS